MEKNLHKVLDEVMNKPGVTGVLCADENGLCLASKGTADRLTSGSLVNLMQYAKKLEPAVPVVALESESKEILLRTDGGFTLAILRNAKK